jgi:hypothetical protein
MMSGKNLVILLLAGIVVLLGFLDNRFIVCTIPIGLVAVIFVWFGERNRRYRKSRTDVQHLIGELTHKDTVTRRNAAQALGVLKDNQAAESLVTALRDENPNVQFAAAEALQTLGGLTSDQQQALIVWKAEQQELKSQDEIIDQGQHTICQNCRTNKFSGETYTAYYAQFFSGRWSPHTHVLGSSNIFFCDLCVARRFSGSNFAVIFFLFVGGLVLLATGLVVGYDSISTNNLTVENILYSLGGLIFGVSMVFGGYRYYSFLSRTVKAIESGDMEAIQKIKRFQAYQNVGDNLAIQVLSAQLRKQNLQGRIKGHLVFFTRSGYNYRRNSGQFF